jgi:NAD(P)-dependent dehydrogenase (short-subunit alcohol dehydrogenase family)
MKDKVVIVTGAAKGIGRETAITFAKEGAKLGIVDIDKENLRPTADKIEKLGAYVITSNADISKSQEVHDFVEKIDAEYKGIDVLINCAVIIIYETFLDFDEKAWRRMLDVDLTGYFLFSQAVAKKMVEKKRRGRIINFASIGADFAVDRAVAYASCKAGVIGLTKVMALELGPLGINVNAISPGAIDTVQGKSVITKEEIEGRKRASPLKRYGRPEDVAKAVLFLASDDAKYITGTVLRVDGGISWTRPKP